MRKRTTNAILRAIAHVDKARDILARERERLEAKNESPDLADDIGWTESHLDQATTEGLEHHTDS